jgi:hypothetical protein
VTHRVDLAQRRAVPHQLQREAGGETSVKQRDDHLGLADRHAPRRDVPFGMPKQPATDEDVHDTHADRRRATLSARVEAAGLGRVDPEARGLHEAVQCGVAGVRPGQREWLDDRVLCVCEQGRRAREAERRWTQAPKRRRPEQHPISVKPVRIAL